MPTPVPMMAASASGLSITRLEPNFRCRSSVTRKTPPSTPTSSPITSTSSSRSISWSSARFRALTMFSLATSASRRALAAHRGRRLTRSRRRPAAVLALAQPAGGLLALGLEVRRQLGVDVLEHRQRLGGARRLEALDGGGDLGVDRLFQPVLEQPLLLEVGGEAREGILALPLGDFLGGAVLRRIVGRGVDAEAIGDALDQRGPVALARAGHRRPAGRPRDSRRRTSGASRSASRATAWTPSRGTTAPSSRSGAA